MSIGMALVGTKWGRIDLAKDLRDMEHETCSIACDDGTDDTILGENRDHYRSFRNLGPLPIIIVSYLL